ncbi:MAG: hypothetical protein JHD35_12470 [Sphingopyxis sp.]|nr:hypothetical protein [Sphingopyxis sp.]
MLVEEVHDAICTALVAAGGSSCDDLIGDPNATKADVFFVDAGTIVEVKSLTTDRNRTASVRQKSAEILDHSARYEGGAVFFGDVTIELGDLPKKTADKLLMNLGARVAKEIRKANQQIKCTARTLGVRPKGLLIFGVPGHFDTHAGVVVTTASRVLGLDKHRAIEGIMVIGVPIEGRDTNRPLTLSYHSRSFDSIPQGLIDRIAKSWVRHLETSDGKPVSVEYGAEQEFMAMMIVDDSDHVPPSNRNQKAI